MEAEQTKTDKQELRPFAVSWEMRGTTIVMALNEKHAEHEFEILKGGFKRYAEDAHTVTILDTNRRSD